MITVYSKNNCPACDSAKMILRSKNIQFNEIKIDETLSAREFLLSEGHRSVPQFYQDGMLIQGGVENISKLLLEA
jgi:glutaredoxin